MSQRLETEHRGYPIYYGENSDKWHCRDIDLQADTLSALKRKIDEIDRKARQAAAVICYELVPRRGHQVETRDAKLIEYLGTRRPQKHQGDPDEPQHVVASMAKRSFGERVGRQEVKLRDLVPISEEAHKAIDHANALGAKVAEAEAAYKAAVAAIPRLQIDDIDGLVKVAGADQ